MVQDAGTGLRALLAWYQAMGVDEIIGTEPVPRYQTKAQAQASAAAGAGANPAQAATQAPRVNPAELSISSAKAIAAECQTLDALREAMDGFEQCPLKRTATRLVFSDGTAGARVMCVGEAPGQEEDRQGKPFVGRSGQLLDLMLGAIGLDRQSADAGQSAYIANILPWRPPLNRKPELTEIQMCLPFLHRHIALARPDIVIALGGTAAQHLLDSDQSMRSMRGRWHELAFSGHKVAVMATYHPAYLLRTPIAKRNAWADFLAVRLRLSQGPG